MFSSLSFNRSSAQLQQRGAVRTSETEQNTRMTNATVSAKQGESSSVTFSDEARERLAASRKIAASVQSYHRSMQDARKDQARERLEVVKRRMDELKRLLMMFGGIASKGLIRELRQLAGELGQAAKVLSETSGATSMSGQFATAGGDASSTTDAQVGTVESQNGSVIAQAEAGADAAAQEPSAQALPAQASQDSDTEPGEEQDAEQAQETAQAAQRQADAQQRRDDAKSLQDAIRAMKALLAMLKSSLRAEDNDKETQKRLKEIATLIEDSEQAAAALSMGGGLSVDVAVSVQVSV